MDENRSKQKGKLKSQKMGTAGKIFIRDKMDITWKF